MLTFNHSINLVTEIDPKTAPANVLNSIANMPEEILTKIFIDSFIDALNTHKFLDMLNENNTYATLKLGQN